MKGPLWRGVYKTLQDVPVRGRGFSGETWQDVALKRLKMFRAMARQNRTIPPVLRFGESLLPVLVALRSTPGKPVRILDFGGGVGLSYYIIKAGLETSARIDLHIVELEEVCQAGRRAFRKETDIHFHSSLDAYGSTRPDIVHVGSSLQYVEEWQSLLKRLCAFRARHLVLTNIPMGDIPTFATAQKYYESEIASWFFNAREVAQVVRSQRYRLALRSTYALKLWGVEQPYPQDNFAKKYRVGHPGSMLFTRVARS